MDLVPISRSFPVSRYSCYLPKGWLIHTACWAIPGKVGVEEIADRASRCALADSSLPAGADISSLLLIYGFPISLIGFALKYAELKPVELRSTQEALSLR